MKNINVVFDILIPKSKYSFTGQKNIPLSLFRQGCWTREDFRHFLNTLFSNRQRPYLVLSDRIDEYFRETDFNHDGKIAYEEFLQAWKETIRCVRRVTLHSYAIFSSRSMIGYSTY